MSELVDRLLREREAAIFLNVTEYWLQRQRWMRTGPAFIRIGGPAGRAIRYRTSDLQAWVSENTIQPFKGKGRL